jgi:hypothetical protein
MNHRTKTLEAIDLFIEDIRTPHSKIRTIAKKRGCNEELTIYRDFVLEYLQNIRTTVQGNSKL